MDSAQCVVYILFLVADACFEVISSAENENNLVIRGGRDEDSHDNDDDYDNDDRGGGRNTTGIIIGIVCGSIVGVIGLFVILLMCIKYWRCDHAAMRSSNKHTNRAWNTATHQPQGTANQAYATTDLSQASTDPEDRPRPYQAPRASYPAVYGQRTNPAQHHVHPPPYEDAIDASAPPSYTTVDDHLERVGALRGDIPPNHHVYDNPGYTTVDEVEHTLHYHRDDH